MIMRLPIILVSLAVLLLAACSSPYPPTPKPDYTIRVIQTPNGMVAVPPPCPSWVNDTSNPYDNQPLPQFGCANARNLAMMVERPEDLTQGRPLGPTSGVTSVGSMVRYNNNQTRGLIWTGQEPNQMSATTASTATSAMTGEMTSGSSGGSSGGASSGGAAASAAAP